MTDAAGAGAAAAAAAGGRRTAGPEDRGVAALALAFRFRLLLRRRPGRPLRGSSFGGLMTFGGGAGASGCGSGAGGFTTGGRRGARRRTRAPPPPRGSGTAKPSHHLEQAAARAQASDGHEDAGHAAGVQQSPDVTTLREKPRSSASRVLEHAVDGIVHRRRLLLRQHVREADLLDARLLDDVHDRDHPAVAQALVGAQVDDLARRPSISAAQLVLEQRQRSPAGRR